MVKRKDTGMYLRYLKSMVKQHEESMRYSTRRFNEENMRTKLGCHAYHMRHWLRLLRCSRSSSSYPLPMSMRTWGGIDRNMKYLKNTEINIWNLFIMTRDFNIRDNLWDPLYPHYSSLSDNLFIIADYLS